MILLAVVGCAAVLAVGTTGIVRGSKWFWNHSGCVVHNGVKACKDKAAHK